MKSSKFYPPSPQAPKISDKTIAEYAALSDAEQEAEQRADDAQRLKDKKQAYIHDFAVAAFGSAFALLLEHMGDIVDFIKRLFELL